MTALTIGQFRTDFPEFANTTTYPDASLTFYLGLANNLFNLTKWGTMLNYGMELYIAHHIILEQRASAQSALGASPGLGTGAVSSKSVGGVSLSYDVNSSSEKDAGHWNLTVYGTRFYALMNMFGAGGYQTTC